MRIRAAELPRSGAVAPARHRFRIWQKALKTMVFGIRPNRALQMVTLMLAALLLALAPQIAAAQDTAEAPAEAAEVAADDGAATEAATGGYTPLGPDMIKGQPVDGEINLQPQFSEIGQTANGLHMGLVWVMVIISVFVLALLIWVVVRYNRRANATPSKTTHNTLIEVVWTVVPVLILVGIAIPSISLLAKQYESPPEDAVTIKAIGYQWYWGYEYPDNGGFEVISNMMPEDEAIAKGFPGQLEVDNRMVVPVNTPLRIQTTAADVIHSFAVPSLWFKLDAVPGRINEKLLVIKEPGIYYGQCSELCGIKHAYMPIAVEALPRDQWEAWVRQQPGGTVAGDNDTPAEAAQEAAANTDAPAADPVADQDEPVAAN